MPCSLWRLLICGALWLAILPNSILHIGNAAVLEDKEYWRKLADEEIQRVQQKTLPIIGVAENVILFLGDGMGITTLTAARIYKGQLSGKSGEEGYLTFEQFPNLALLKTYNVDRQVPDSAATATAFLSGVKANKGTLGVDANVIKGNCSSYDHRHASVSFLVQAVDQGKSVGIVTNTAITDATPASAYAHSADRAWQSDTDRDKRGFASPEDHQRCPDIAQQLLSNAIPFRVIMGGGRGKFLPLQVSDPVNQSLSGERSDRRNLITEWKRRHWNMKHKAKVVYTKSGLRDVNLDEVDYLLGLFAPDHMAYEHRRRAEKLNEPSLTEMVSSAMRILRRNPKGFVLLVEGGLIDRAHHVTQAGVALSETVSFDNAVATTLTQINASNTLVMVTADHSHVLTMGTYPSRGNNILGKSDEKTQAADNKPVTTLLYANGPTGLSPNQSRTDESQVDTTRLGYQYQSFIKARLESHGGEDVAIYAQGPWSHLFQSVHEQTHVAQVARFAACLPPYVGERCVPGK